MQRRERRITTAYHAIRRRPMAVMATDRLVRAAALAGGGYFFGVDVTAKCVVLAADHTLQLLHAMNVREMIG